MAGTLDFEECRILCPDCGLEQEVLTCIDYDPKDNKMPTEIGLSGGHHECTECGYIMTDKDNIDWDLF